MFEWRDHHFINRLPCLDLANTVVWRSLPGKLEDRLETAAQLTDWVRAAQRYGGLTEDAQPQQSLDSVLLIREAIDGYFRRGEGWSVVVRLYASALEEGGTSFEREILHSALQLALSNQAHRVKICGNCGWLFIDRTRNGNKRWCTTEICGNRTKARRHYSRKVQRLREEGAGIRVTKPERDRLSRER
jgi:predicted RNA-binding Zn ribbon-like protein